MASSGFIPEIFYDDVLRPLRNLIKVIGIQLEHRRDSLAIEDSPFGFDLVMGGSIFLCGS